MNNEEYFNSNSFKVNDDTFIYIEITNNYSLVGTSIQDDYWCNINIAVKNDNFNYYLDDEAITTKEIDKIKDMIKNVLAIDLKKMQHSKH